MVEREEPIVVKSKVTWDCPRCWLPNHGETWYSCFTHFAICSGCGLKVIPTSDGEDIKL